MQKNLLHNFVRQIFYRIGQWVVSGSNLTLSGASVRKKIIILQAGNLWLVG
jgi:hypothetical protein